MLPEILKVGGEVRQNLDLLRPVTQLPREAERFGQ
jgi:hypothetical protein